MKTLPAAILCIAGGLIASSAYGATARDGAQIANSGSTNAPGYTLKLWSDGQIAVMPSNRAGAAIGAQRMGAVPVSLASRFFADVQNAKRNGDAGPATCMKSASFGSSTVVSYHGWRSADLECSRAAALTTDVHAIVAAAGAGRPIVRRPLMPNEFRRPELTPQASASPESHRPTL